MTFEFSSMIWFLVFQRLFHKRGSVWILNYPSKGCKERNYKLYKFPLEREREREREEKFIVYLPGRCDLEPHLHGK